MDDPPAQRLQHRYGATAQAPAPARGPAQTRCAKCHPPIEKLESAFACAVLQTAIAIRPRRSRAQRRGGSTLNHSHQEQREKMKMKGAQ